MRTNRARTILSCVFLARPVLSCPHYFKVPVTQATGFVTDSRSINFPCTNVHFVTGTIHQNKKMHIYILRGGRFFFFFVILLLVKKPHQLANLTKAADVFHFNRIKVTQSEHA